ncbi:hypothetical protein [Persicobacter diffluens]|uniref:Outer membrane protein beta-barrel domain-containing protein n=1 Tax=Persicobacter diffluens TaxID=981 RepID=A0AAN4W1W8_9BACT|nr:hypothetical protein PEDI_38860 [Persicobacter diffluens]
MLKKKMLGTLLLVVFTFATAQAKTIGESDQAHPTAHQEHQKHFELEVSLTDEAHMEFTGSVYFFRENKIQLTADQSGHHFASVLVHEIPFHHSHWGTFLGAGMNFGFEKEEATATPIQEAGHHLHWDKAVLVQSGLAYNIDDHWSTGFTLSPAFDLNEKVPDFAMTFDVVFGF